MRLLYLVHQYLPDYVGGTERHTQALAGAMSRRGHQVAIVSRRSAPGTGEAVHQEGAVLVWSIWSGMVNATTRFLATWHEPALVRCLARVLEETGPDLVHIHHLMGMPVAALRLLRQRGIPFVLTLHDYWWICPNAQLLTNDTRQVCAGPDSLSLNCARCALAYAGRERWRIAAPFVAGLMAWRRNMLRQVLHTARCLVAPTEFVREWYVAHGVPAERIAVVPHGIDPPEARGVISQGGSRRLRLLYLGGLAWQKGIHVVLGAMRGLEGTAELEIAGDERGDPGYAGLLQQQAPPNVRFLGRLTRREAWAALARADALVAPSLWYETFALVVHEAFAARVPVVASRLGALEEAVRHEVNGLLVPPGDVEAWRTALNRLAGDRALLAQLRANAPLPINTAQHAERLEALYRTAIPPRQSDGYSG